MFERELAETVEFLESDRALEMIAADPYWPKWNGPWWRMLILWELGEHARIPHRVVRAMVAGLDSLLHVFPIRPGDAPEGYDPSRSIACHCALGCMDQVLSACGVDVDRELPWIRTWFERYQMSDGGLNCDEGAYLVTDECPSSMVATVPVLEAMLRRGPSAFVDRAARFLAGRALVHGSPTRHNAEERAAAERWALPTFPRFYFYDVLRGATAYARYATLIGEEWPAFVTDAVRTIARDGVVHVGRHAFDDAGTHDRDAAGAWVRLPKAHRFPLLDAVSQIGAPSEVLTREWQRLIDVQYPRQ
ncbi:MAG TPA: hypothetical protein VFQ65_27080 [Kofleriaceae bacterium]|nr:hypothetical protein [Kofleriaceae bacterium]